MSEGFESVNSYVGVQHARAQTVNERLGTILSTTGKP